MEVQVLFPAPMERQNVKIRGAQWNIQAARVLEDGADPLDKHNYRGDDPEYFAGVLANLDLDFVTLQEVHSNDSRDQAIEIAKVLGFDHVRTDSYEPKSFMDENYSLGQSIISRYPIDESFYEPIDYTRFEIENPTNAQEHWMSRENGFSVISTKIGSSALQLVTTHLVPFEWLNKDPFGDGPSAEIRGNAVEHLEELGDRWILQGDFNVKAHSIGRFIESVANRDGYREVVQSSPTTPPGAIVDHIATMNVPILENRVDNTVRADHFLLVTEYEI